MDDEKHVLPVEDSSGRSRKIEVIFKDDASEVVLLRKKYEIAATIADIRKRDPSKNGKVWAELKSFEFGENTSIDLSGDAREEGVNLISFENETHFSADSDATEKLEQNMCWALQKTIDQFSAPFMALLQSEELAINNIGWGGKYVSALATVDFFVQEGSCTIIARRNSESKLEFDPLTLEELCSDTRTFEDLVKRVVEEAFTAVADRIGE